MGADFSRFCSFSFGAPHSPSASSSSPSSSTISASVGTPSKHHVASTNTSVSSNYASATQHQHQHHHHHHHHHHHRSRQPPHTNYNQHQHRQHQRQRQNQGTNPGKLTAGALFDDATVANTLVNRSRTPVTRHVALTRLASRLASAGRRQRSYIIRMLGLSPKAVHHLRRYSPANTFVSAPECIDEISAVENQNKSNNNAMNSMDSDNKKSVRSGISGSNGAKRKAINLNVNVNVNVNVNNGHDGDVHQRRNKCVSFSPLVELRFFNSGTNTR